MQGVFGIASVRWGWVALVCVALVVGVGVDSAAGADRSESSDAATAVVGGFGLGDGVEGLVDERLGSLTVGVPVGGLGVSWSSELSGANRFGLGAGWGISGVGFVDTVGGVRVFPSSGGMFAADASVLSGLQNYVLDDVRFTRLSGVHPARPDAVVGSRSYAYRLVELGGVSTFFNAAGDPVVRVDAHGNRTDWVWQAGHRLVRVVSPEGVTTRLDWTVPAQVQVTTSATPTGAGTTVTGVVYLQQQRVAELKDSSGGRTAVSYTPDGLVAGVRGVSGADTEVIWQSAPDGTVAVDRVRVRDGRTGTVVSEREWDAISGLASGYPTYAGAAELFASGDDAYRYSTAVSDGATTVESEYNSQGLLVARETRVTTSSGQRTVQRHAFTYPGTETGGVPDPRALPDQYNRPIEASITYVGLQAGRERTVSEEYAFDAYGRVVSQTAPDGTISTTVYDEAVPADRLVPVGLPLVETTVAADGLATQIRHELNDAHTALVASETFTGTTGVTDEAGEVVWTRTGRTEQDVAADGVVTAQRVYPQGGAGTPVATVWERTVDLEAGTVTLTETVAAGTPLATTTTEATDLVHGRPVSVTDATGNTTHTEYDAAGRPTTRTTQDGLVTNVAYRTQQQHGDNAVVTTTPDGVETTETRDVLGRVVTVADNLKLTDPKVGASPVAGHVRLAQTRHYPKPGVVQITDSWGAVTTTQQDVFGREVETVAPNGLTKITRYDDVENSVTTALTPTGRLEDAEITTTEIMNERGDVAATTGIRTDGVPVLEASTRYDGWGRVVASTDGIVSTGVEFDAMGNAVTTTISPVGDPTGAAVAGGEGEAGGSVSASYRFDSHGVSVQKTLTAEGQSRSGSAREVDGLGRTVSETDQVGSTTRYAYTSDGLVSSITTEHGQITENSYHPVTRALVETRTTSPVGEPVHQVFEYHPVTGAVVAVFDPAAPDATRIEYAYDAHGNVLSTRYPDGSTISHSYDVHGRKLSTTDTAGNVTTFAYDPAGLVTSVVQTDPSGEKIAQVEYVYDSYGRMAELTRGNGVVTRYTFTSVNQIATEATTGPDGQLQSDRAYTYDPAGNLINRIDRVRTAESGDLEATTTEYEYDAHHRLTGSRVHAGADATAPVVRHTVYELTVSGDISTETVTTDAGTERAQTTTREFGYTSTGHLVWIRTAHPDGTTKTQTQEYDSAGNLVHAADGSQYAYNALDRLITETTPSGDTVHTEYWATGQRATLTHDRSTTSFYWDGATLANDAHATEDSPVEVVSYLLVEDRHARTTDAGTLYYTHDRHGNVTELTNIAGAVAARYTFADYGVTTAHPTAATTDSADLIGPRVGDASYQPFQYAGEYTTPTPAQLQHLHSREFDSRSMRFTTEDTEKLHNRYAYANLNPIINVDPTGKSAAADGWNTTLLVFSILLTIVSVAAAAFTGGTSLGGFGVAVAAAGTAANAFTAALSIGAMLSAQTNWVSEDAKEFFTSPLTQASAAVLGVGMLAAGYLVTKAAAKLLPSLAKWNYEKGRIHRNPGDPEHFAKRYLYTENAGKYNHPKWQAYLQADPLPPGPKPATYAGFGPIPSDLDSEIRSLGQEVVSSWKWFNHTRYARSSAGRKEAHEVPDEINRHHVLFEDSFDARPMIRKWDPSDEPAVNLDLVERMKEANRLVTGRFSSLVHSSFPTKSNPYRAHKVAPRSALILDPEY